MTPHQLTIPVEERANGEPLLKNGVMICRYCGNPAKCVPNEEIYNGKRYGKSYMFWYCKPCDAYVGTHNNDPNNPKGQLANKETREAKKKAHRIVDEYWQSGKMKRGWVYSRLTKYFGEETHIGWSDVKRANEIAEIAPIILEMDKEQFDLYLAENGLLTK